MKRKFCVLLGMAILALPATGISAAHSMDHSAMDHGKMQHEGMKHEGMQAEGAMVMLPEQTADGIKAMAHLKDVKAAMAKMQMKETHHFMIMLSDVKSGKELVPQLVAVKIVDPAGKESAPIELMAMQGHAGADVILPAPGEYKFKVAARLADGKKVQFEFVTKVK